MSSTRRAALLAIGIGLGGCGRSGDARPRPNPCDALAITANRAQHFRDAASGQLALEVTTYKRWEAANSTRVAAGQVQAPGTYDEDQKRSFAYHYSGLAMCSAANALDDDLARFAGGFAEPLGAGSFKPTPCAGFLDNAANQAGWTQAAADAAALESRVVASCYAKHPGTPPTPGPALLMLLSE